jgi:hypothetical protein
MDNPQDAEPDIPLDEETTLLIDLPDPDVYRIFVRGYNPSDERDGLPPFTEFPRRLVISKRLTALRPPKPTGTIPATGDVIAIPAHRDTIPHRLQWDPIPGANGYVVYLAAANDSPLLNFENVGDITRYNIDALPPGSYTWQMIGISERGAVPDYGVWGTPQHFEVIDHIMAPVVIQNVTRNPDAPDTAVVVHWAEDGSPPAAVRVYHYYEGRTSWEKLPEAPLTDVDMAERTGVYTVGTELATPGAHFLLIRGINADGDKGEFMLFDVP